MNQMIDILKKNPVIPVMVIEKLEDAVPLARALVAGGLDVLEVTLRTDVAIAAIRDIKSALPDAIVGAGTVIDSQTLQASQQVGADFIVSPGMTDKLLEEMIAESVNLLPGAMTVSEAMTLAEAGFHCLKFFPAQAAGGCEILRSISGPLPQLTFCPTGGISMANAAEYLSLSNVACVGGSWMLDKQLIEQKDWQQITTNCAAICSELRI